MAYTFFFSTGSGLEKFACNSLIIALSKTPNILVASSDVVKVLVGKVLVNTDRLPALHEMMCVERAFVCICYFDSPWRKGACSIARADALKFIFRNICSDRIVLSNALQRWQSVNNVAFQESQAYFRVDCKCRGRVGSQLLSERLAGQLGLRISRLMNWPIRLRRSRFTIVVHINDDYVIAGIPLHEGTLAEKPYLMNPGLRSTVCQAMCAMANLEPGMVVADPMCGKGTLLIEAAHGCKGLELLGSDVCPKMLADAKNALQHAMPYCSCLSWHLLQADVRMLPLRNSAVDRILCDVPFGNKFKTPQALTELYCSLLHEIRRVLNDSGRIVLLIPASLQSNLRALATESRFCWLDVNLLSMGNTSAAIVVLAKFALNK